MNALARTMRRIPAIAQAVLGLSAGWAVWIWLAASHPTGFREWFAVRGWSIVGDALAWVGEMVGQNAGPLLFGSSLVVPAALLARMVARARVRAGLPDPIDRMRDWTAAHAKSTRAALAIPALAWFADPMRRLIVQIVRGLREQPTSWLETLRTLTPGFYAYVAFFACATAVTALAVHAGLRGGLRALLSPTVGPEQAVSKPDERIGFAAVAVTRETRMAVAAMAALSLITMFVMLRARLNSTGVEAALAAYLAIAVAAIDSFRRASRVAIGVDGVFVTGTSRSRFFAYNDLDSVRVRGSDIELVRKGRVILRLQLHGEDAIHRGAIVARIGEAVDAAKARTTAAVGDLVVASSEAELARLAEGARGYRTQSVTREQLWAVVEGSEHGGEARTAAAKALATTAGESHAGDRTRMRVAAERSAEPRVRVALEELATDDAEVSGESVEANRSLASEQRWLAGRD